MLYIRDFDLRNGDYATARARYARAFPNLFATDQPKFEKSIDYGAAIELALVLKGTGELERARVLLDRAEAYMQTVAGIGNRRFYVLAIHAARGDTARVMATLREIARGGPQSRWRYYRDFAPELASIRNDAEFKALFADIERAMASQRAALAKRPKDAPLENRVIVAPGPAASGPVRSPLPTSRHS
jgi:tetratricopeptide (TPR) repeat protein